ncbi:MAG: tRNA (cytidine(34)-2'-O)-methyltransferase [Acidobacteria bacterium]|jgi:tRNA (cytidine/uridine-2'-O-)-methyltransferase|nr:MAG: tRNA (cytidine(34)-2'-O)-methyltransferase [Acidobacteriota bacterium]GIU82561.1 MAG: putative tRNA (cytidine(34)-2'-O)-methyltransferase [Pyrinomonadaceae bacterium]
MLHVALFEPEIPPNTGNIARLCAATFTPLHIVGVTGFRMDDKALKRAGLDYWDYVKIYRHIDLEELYESLPNSRFLYFSTKGERIYTDWEYKNGDCLVFGPETRGLPENLLRANWDRCLKIPMPNSNVRSLNLATSVAIALYEALRQVGFPSGYDEKAAKLHPVGEISRHQV